MSVSSSIQEQTEVIRLTGRFDFGVRREFRGAVKRALANSSIREIEIDLGTVEYIDSSALGMLLLSRENAEEAEKEISLARATGSAKQLLDAVNFQKRFTIK